MTIFDVARNAVLAGFGMQEKVREFVDELVKKGELSESQAAKLMKEWADKADKGSSELCKTISDTISTTLDKMKIPSKDDFDKMNQKIDEISARLKKLEGGGGCSQ
ncbi:MAG: phasin family protein [Nitrospirae bacterium]|nr:phasin family protein [Nitrospirota bacterium]